MGSQSRKRLASPEIPTRSFVAIYAIAAVLVIVAVLALPSEGAAAALLGIVVAASLAAAFALTHQR